MAIRIRIVDGVTVAICAARSVARDGDVYLDDTVHHALTDKFAADFTSEGYGPLPQDDQVSRLREQEESNNLNRLWWDKVYGPSTNGPGWAMHTASGIDTKTERAALETVRDLARGPSFARLRRHLSRLLARRSGIRDHVETT